MPLEKPYADIPGTYVMDGEHSRKGYHLNMFCMSLNKKQCREKFAANEESYLDTFPMTVEQRRAVLQRDWIAMLRLGGNIYYTFKIAIFDGLSMQAAGGKMSGMSEADFQKMMIDGGRPVQGNRYTGDWSNG